MYMLHGSNTQEVANKSFEILVIILCIFSFLYMLDWCANKGFHYYSVLTGLYFPVSQTNTDEFWDNNSHTHSHTNSHTHPHNRV